MNDPASRTRAVVALAVMLPVPTLGVWFGMVLFPKTALGAGLFFAAKVWILAVPVLWHFLVEKQDSTLLRLSVRGCATGLALGLVMAAGIWIAQATLGQLLFDPVVFRSNMRAIGMAHRLVFVALAFYWIVVNSLLEEFVWRWFVTRQFQALVASGPAIALAALGFTCHHIAVTSIYMPFSAVLIANAGIFVASVAWSWCVVRYRSIWPGYISHVLADLAIFTIGYRLLFGG